MTRLWLAISVSYLLAFSAQAQNVGEERIAITAITPSVNTGQDYSPWLDDNLNNLVQNYWGVSNLQYIDVTLTLAKSTVLSRLSLFDYQGVFTTQPALIYAQSGTQRTLIGTFTGDQYNVYVDMLVSGTVTADAIVVHKFYNNIPVKIKVFGKTSSTTTPVAAAITFGALPTKTVGAAPFTLSATSTNTATPITFASSNPSVVSVAQSNGTWQATVVGAGTATITASQAASSAYLAATASQTQTVQAAVVTPVAATITFGALATKTVGAAPFALAATSTNTATPITFTSSNPSVVSVAQTNGTWQATAVGVGTAVITASQAASGAYLAATATQTQTVQAAVVTPVAATITFGALPAKTVGAAAFTLSATSTNTATPITFSSSNSSVVSVAQSNGTWQATVVGAGTATVTASQAASSTYLAATASQTQTVQAATTTATTGIIPLDASRWYQLTNAPNAIAPLFDGATSTAVTVNWGKVIPAYDSYYALQPGETITLSSIRFYDGPGANPSDPLTLSVITDTWQRIPVATFTGTQYNTWVGPNPNQPGTYALSVPISNIRYLVITASWGYPTEIELTGTYTAGTPLAATDAATLAVQRAAKLGPQMGINGFEWDVEDPNNPIQIDQTRLNGLKNFTGFRHYMDWQKLESTEGGYTYNPVHSGGWNYDALYQRLKAEGITVLADLKTLPDWLLNTYPSGDRDSENVPVRYGKSFSDPASYIEQAKVAFQYAARYGANPNVPASLVTVDQSTRWAGDGVNQVKIGLNLVHYIECDNERDKWWKGRKAYQTGREYAANMSAFYDGHKNTMGAGVGIKNADPTMQVVMAGVASATPDYVRGMIDWCREFRGYRADGSVNLCWDIINYHYYANNAGTSQGGNATRGAAPEVSGTAQIAQAFIKMAHQYAAGMPVWVTEAGYDSNQGSPLKAIAIGNKTVAQTQADWILRTALLSARWGVERTFFYELSDDNVNSAVQFSSSGLINSDRSAKPAADFLRQANALLGAYTYTGTLNNDPLVDRYQLGSKTAYVLTVPDETNRTATYSLNLGTDSASIYKPQAGQVSMSVQRVRTQGGVLQLTVTETPQFVLAGGGTPTTTMPPTTACANTGTIGWEQWTNIGGTDVANIPTATTPNNTATLTQFESGYNLGDNYGVRIRGYICPPQDGSYVFQIAGDDMSQLWLSADDNPANKVLIASVTGWTYPGEWSKYATQHSAAISLLAGHRYYVETLQKEGGGGDFVSVGWTLPSGTVEAPIAGSHLMPFTTTATANAKATTSPTSSRAVATTTTTSGGDSSNGEAPGLTVYPNPFTSHRPATIQFVLPRAGQATLELYDVQQRLVRRLFAGPAEAGTPQQFSVDGASLAAGMYLVRLVTSENVFVQKLVRAE